MKNVFVRINPNKKTQQRFFRAGFSFTKEWQQVEVDDATLSTLQAEQMLEVTDSLVSPEIVEGQDGSTGSPRADENLLPTSEEPPPASDIELRDADVIMKIQEIMQPEAEKSAKKGKA